MFFLVRVIQRKCPIVKLWCFSVFQNIRNEIFGFRTISQTKQAISKRHRWPWGTVFSIFTFSGILLTKWLAKDTYSTRKRAMGIIWSGRHTHLTTCWHWQNVIQLGFLLIPGGMCFALVLLLQLLDHLLPVFVIFSSQLRGGRFSSHSPPVRSSAGDGGWKDILKICCRRLKSRELIIHGTLFHGMIFDWNLENGCWCSPERHIGAV